MKLLVVNYGTAHLDRLREICEKHQLTVADGAGFSGLVDNALDGVVVIGDAIGESGPWTDSRQAMVGLMQAGDMPVFGMGAGFTVVCAAMGADMTELAELDEGAPKIIPTEDGVKAYQGSDPILVKATERWCLDELPRGIATLARSESGIEAVRSKSKPLFAMQQLPDDFTYSSDGKLVIQNFLSLM
jgi:anthranilate/para-aminobenzoate synthase component II